MTTDEMNQAIAEFCGWVGVQRNGNRIIGIHPLTAKRKLEGSNGGFQEIPSFTTDLNAIHEAEARLDNAPTDDRSLYLDHLMLICGEPNAKTPAEARFEAQYRSVRATAAQRAEALLRTIGKFQED